MAVALAALSFVALQWRMSGTGATVQVVDGLPRDYPYYLEIGAGWNAWRYTGSFYAVCPKDVQVRIRRLASTAGDAPRAADWDSAPLLTDTLHFARVAGVQATASVEPSGTLTLSFREVGFVNPDRPPRPDDPYNAALEKSGGRLLRTVTYRYNAAKGRFEPSR